MILRSEREEKEERARKTGGCYRDLLTHGLLLNLPNCLLFSTTVLRKSHKLCKWTEKETIFFLVIFHMLHDFSLDNVLKTPVNEIDKETISSKSNLMYQHVDGSVWRRGN